MITTVPLPLCSGKENFGLCHLCLLKSFANMLLEKCNQTLEWKVVTIEC